MELVGAQYVAEGVPLLRLIGLSAPFTVRHTRRAEFARA
jgi:hypothetical protein